MCRYSFLASSQFSTEKSTSTTSRCSSYSLKQNVRSPTPTSKTHPTLTCQPRDGSAPATKPKSCDCWHYGWTISNR